MVINLQSDYLEHTAIPYPEINMEDVNRVKTVAEIYEGLIEVWALFKNDDFCARILIPSGRIDVYIENNGLIDLMLEKGTDIEPTQEHLKRISDSGLPPYKVRTTYH